MPTFHSRASLKLRLIIALLLLGLSSWYIFAGSSDSPHASFDLSSLSPPRLRNSRNSNSAPSPTLSSTPITKPILSNEPSIQVDEVISVFDSFLHQLHISFAGNKKATPEHVWQLYFDLAIKTLLPFDKHYAAHMPPRRDDDTIFLSLASYRDENCLPTLTGAYEKADNPAKLFVGLVQQNCLENCRSGVLESGGMEDVEPDDDCGKLFCEARPDLCSQVRVLRVNETEALGPYSGRYETHTQSRTVWERQASEFRGMTGPREHVARDDLLRTRYSRARLRGITGPERAIREKDSHIDRPRTPFSLAHCTYDRPERADAPVAPEYAVCE